MKFVLNQPRATAVQSAPGETALQRGVPNKSFRVFIRARPFLPREAGMQSCLDISPLQDWDPPPKWDGPSPDKVTVHKEKEFVFDRVFGPEATQEEVYDAVGKPLVDSVLGGHSSCLFAYGQTGSGKTFSMEGQSDPGVMMRCIQYLCDTLEPSFKMSITYVQLYNDCLLDLFSPTHEALEVVDSSEGARVAGAKPLVSRCPQQILQAVRIGAAYRASGATNMNDASSRSHAILSIHIEPDNCCESEAETKDEGKSIAKAKAKGTAKAKAKPNPRCSTARVFHIVDLAGSERVKRSGATGSRFEEAVAINSALLHLGNVVSALVECDGAPRSHIPYRDSILTRLLQNALGGRSRTALIACVTPSEDSASETLNTLAFASRATHIKNLAEEDASSNDELSVKEEEKLEANQYRPSFDENGKTVIQACGKDIECYGNWDAGPKRPLVVLLHYYGFGGGASMWHFLFTELIQSGARFLAPNFPGHEGTKGSSSSKPEDMSKPGGPVEILQGLLDAVGEKKAIVVGFDWGGGIAAEFALAHSKRVKKLALWCMSYRDSSKLAGLAVRNKDLLFMWDKNDQNRSPKKGKEFAAVLKSKYYEYSGELLVSTLKKWIQ
jgi:predicted esterase